MKKNTYNSYAKLKKHFKKSNYEKYITGFFIDKDLFINKVRINILLVLVVGVEPTHQ